MKSEMISFDGLKWSAPMPALDSDTTLVTVFGASQYVDTPAPLEALMRAFPKSVVVGCSSAGEIHGSKVADGGLSVAVTRFERSTLARAAAVVQKPDESYAAGESLAHELTRPGLRGVLVLSDGLQDVGMIRQGEP